MNIVDFTVLAIVLIFFLFGMKKGFVKSIFGLVSIIISLSLALVLYPVVSEALEKSAVGEYVNTSVEKMVGEKINEKTKDEEKMTNQLGLPSVITDAVSVGVSDVKNSVAKTITTSVSAIALNLLSLLVVFLAVRILIWVITRILDVLTKLPVISGFNKLLGGAFGLVNGVIVVYLLLALLTFCTAMEGLTSTIEAVNQSKVASLMYQNNFLLNFITKSN